MQPTEALVQMIVGTWVSRAIYVAAELGIADLLKDGPHSSEELATATGVDARSQRASVACSCKRWRVR